MDNQDNEVVEEATSKNGSEDFTADTAPSSARSSARVSSRAQAALNEKMAAARVSNGGATTLVSPRRSTDTSRSDKTRDKAAGGISSPPLLGTPTPPTIREIAPSRKQERTSLQKMQDKMASTEGGGGGDDEESEMPGAVRVSSLPDSTNHVDELANTTQEGPYTNGNSESGDGTPLEIEATTVDENRDLEELRQRLDDLENQETATEKPAVIQESAPPSEIPFAEVEEPPETCTKQRIVLCSGLIILALIGVIIAQAVSGNDNNGFSGTIAAAANANKTSAPTFPPTRTPTESPSVTPTLAPSSMPTNERRVFLGDVLLEEFEPLHERAFDWITNVDDWEPPLFLSDEEVIEVWKERYILTVFFFDTGGNVTWSYSDEWLWGNIACRWFGNICTNSRMTFMSLGNHGISGTLPTILGKLTKLRGITLGSNDISGTIPTELGLLTSATRLSLGSNNLEGTIPLELEGMTKLQYLQLQNNRLTGTLPTEIGSLSLLEEINLVQNGFTGPIPSEIGKMVAMEALYFAQNKFTTIPTEIGKLTVLEVMSIYKNFLEGTIPTEIGLMKALSSIFLNNNQLTGTIPTQIGNLTAISRIALYENQLTGTFPAFVDPEYYLWDCDVWGNSFSNTTTTEFLRCDFESP